MYTSTITKADRAALENLWGAAGSWIADTWTALNHKHFDGKLHYHGVVWGLTPHGRSCGYTSPTGRITLHPALLDPSGADPWTLGDRLGGRYAEHALLHEMIHVLLIQRGVAHDESGGHHNTVEWCEEIMRLTGELGWPPVRAMPVRPRRINGVVTRQAHRGYLDRADIAAWPHSIAPEGCYGPAGRIAVPV